MHADYRLFLIASLFVNSYCRLISLCIYDSPDTIGYKTCDDSKTSKLPEYSFVYSGHEVNKREVPLDTNQTIAITESPPVKEETTNIPNNEPDNTTELNEDVTYDPDSRGDDDISPIDLNATEIQYNHHKYYNSYSVSGMENVYQYWVDLNKFPEHLVHSELLSSNYRRAMKITLSFEFPFYGHTIQDVTIATGGFLFTGSQTHKWLVATQYIAPLMANFDPSKSLNSSVRYLDNGTSLTVQWDKVTLQDNPNIGTFTFQTTLHDSGKIVFAYKDVPLIVSNIDSHAHPVKVGLSDAYIVEKTVFFVRKKTIYEYHKIDMKQGFQIGNWTVIWFDPLPNCVTFSTCSQCLTESTTFKCEWCQQIGKCSDGMDRHRQKWLEGNCIHSSISNSSLCATLPSLTTPLPMTAGDPQTSTQGEERLYTQGLVVGLLLFLTIVIGFVGWIAYAYFNPHTSSGQFLIKYRPSAWSWRRGQARYTPATMQSVYM